MQSNGVNRGLPWLLGVLALAWGSAAWAQPGPARSRAGAAAEPPAARLIVGLRALPARAAGEGRARAAAARLGLEVRAERALGARLALVDLERPLGGAELDAALAALAADPEVAFAEPDRRVYRHAVASDALFPEQWHLQGGEAAAIDAATAWDVTPGSAGVVVAVLDTGVRFDHPDLGRAGAGGRLLSGRDFVGPDAGGGYRVASDGNGWDADASDPGDWISDADTSREVFEDCEVQDSSWHGTRVAGMIGAITNNGPGIAGATWSTWILPVRVLGKCFGYTSDILQGMRWAAGLPVDSVPANPYPARILNMSLGAIGSCPASYGSVVQELAARGVLVVASAGNSTGGPVEYPANCPGVLAVAGLRHVGTKVGFSSVGPEVGIAAPGGNCVNIDPGLPCLYSLHTTIDSGRTGPVAPAYTDAFQFNVGTSFAAPSVAAIAALMQAVNANLDGAQLTARLREGARPFPAPMGVPSCRVPLGEFDTQLECSCTTSTCGAGMAHAPGSVAAALRPIAAVVLPGNVVAGQSVTLDAAGSAAACGRTVAGWAWSIVAGPGVLGATTGPTTSLLAPVAGESVTVRLTVTDDQGAEDSAEITLTDRAALSTAPAQAGTAACPVALAPSADDDPAAADSGGGGGGLLDPGALVLLLVAAGGSARRRACGGCREPAR